MPSTIQNITENTVKVSIEYSSNKGRQTVKKQLSAIYTVSTVLL